MKSSILFRNKYALLIACAAFMLTSCKKEVAFDFNGDEVNRVFLNIENYTVKGYNSFNFTIKHTPVGSKGEEIKAEVPARMTLEATEDVKVSYAVDNSSVSAYNAENKTNYIAVPAGIVDLSTTQLTIPKGSTISVDAIKFAIPAEKMSLLTAPGYVIPLKVTSVSGAGAQASSNASTVYVVITTSSGNVYDNTVAADMTGVLNSASRTNWVATFDATASSGTPANLFDASTGTVWYITPARPVTLTVDMVSSRANLSGIRIFTSTTYSLTSANVLSSTDGVTWVSQGSVKLSTVATYQYIKFYAPVTARYLKLEVTGWRTGSARVSFGDFNIYQ